MIKRVAVNFFMGYAVCSAALNLIPIQKEVVPVTVFNSDNDQLTTEQRYKVRKTTPTLFQFNETN